MADDLTTQVAMRRNLAIISHPDAGKTTLTEKLLLYGARFGRRDRSSGRAAAADDERLDGDRARARISISTSVLQFDYAGRRMNLLDTPGNNDFSEDNLSQPWRRRTRR